MFLLWHNLKKKMGPRQEYDYNNRNQKLPSQDNKKPLYLRQRLTEAEDSKNHLHLLSITEVTRVLVCFVTGEG